MSDSSISAYQIRISDSPSISDGECSSREDFETPVDLQIVETKSDIPLDPRLSEGSLFELPSPVSTSTLRGVGPELIGQILFGNYAILDVLGEGGMAIVYKAKQITFDRLVAMKTLKRCDPRLMERFAREALTHCKLKHNNIVDVYDKLELADGRVFLVMEYIEGITLADFIKDGNRVTGEADIENVLVQICDALAYAHDAGVVHRDLKPANVVLFEQDSRVHAKVLDFGLAIMPDVLERLTLQGHTVGSLDYMSPEQCTGIKHTLKSDIYSLGVLTYQMITGHRPYTFRSVAELINAHRGALLEVPPLSKHRTDLPNIELLNEVVAKALSTDPDERHTSADEFKQEIIHWRTMSASRHFARKERLRKYVRGLRKTVKKTKWLSGRKRRKRQNECAEQNIQPNLIILLLILTIAIIASMGLLLVK